MNGKADFIREHAPAAITAVPLILVNGVAIYGQYGYLRDHTRFTVAGSPTIGAAVFAAALESIALYLAYMAHKSLVSLDSSFRLRLAAYGYGLLAGFMNYSHYCPDFRPTFLGIATGLMSVSSPILWGIYSRRISRDKLRELGLIEPGAVRLGINRWLWHFRKAFAVYRFAAWTGIREPQAAITAWEASKPPADIPAPAPAVIAEPVKTPVKAPAKTPVIAQPDIPAIESGPERDSEPERDTLVTGMSKGHAIAMAFARMGDTASAADVSAWLAERGVTVTPDYVRQVRSRNKRKSAAAQPFNVTRLPDRAG